MKRGLLAAGLLAAACSAPPVPPTSPAAGPPAAAFNRQVTPQTVDTTICRPGGYTDSVRPPVAFTEAWETSTLRARGEPLTHRSRYDVDHRLPLALGGHPTADPNLQLLPTDVHDRKTGHDVRLWHAVCDGRLPLDVAQRQAWNWQTSRG